MLQNQKKRLIKRTISWKDIFWVASGTATLVLFSMGSIANTIGTPSWIIWLVSSTIGFLQLFIYTELASMFPDKSGGTSICGSMALIRYNKFLGVIDIWSYWFAWSPTFSIGSALAGSYIVATFFSNTAFANFSITFVDLSHVLPNTKFSLNASSLLGILICLLLVYIQHKGLLKTVKTQFLLALLSIIPIFALGIVPLVIGKINFINFVPLIPKGTDSWFSKEAFSLVMGSMFIAGWSTYAGELAVCYSSECKEPEKDTVYSILSVGILAFFCFTLLPFTFLGVLGVGHLSDTSVVNGDPQTAILKLAQITFDADCASLLTLMLVCALLLSINGVIAGTSRTLYQASIDGFLPKFLGKLNEQGTPVNALWVDFVVNVILIMLGSPIFVLAAASVAYMLSISMDLIATWLLRKTHPQLYRPYRAPNFLINVIAPILAFINIAFIIFGANTFAPNALYFGIGMIALVIPIFWYRHYLVDKGIWPQEVSNFL